MFYLNDKNLYIFSLVMYILIGVVLIAMIAIGILLLVVYKKGKKNGLVNPALFEEVYLALGKDNIKEASYIQNRVSIIINDIKLVDNNALTKLGLSAFLKGNSITILFKSGSTDLVKYINQRMGEK